MVELGLLEEAKWLYDNYLMPSRLVSIGYRELFPYFAEPEFGPKPWKTQAKYASIC